MSENVPPFDSPRTANDLVPSSLRRFIPMLAVIVTSIAVVGFISGIREFRKVERNSIPAPQRASDVPRAVTYSELRATNLGPNASWQQSLAQLKYDKPGVFDAVIRTEDMKLAALAERAKNRAYDGAPPTIPHPVEAQSAASCLACHGEGLKVGDRIASRMSHALLTNCTQCHVEQVTVPTENSFVGVYRSGPGERASPGAPPIIPHHTWMRENCTSCHGLMTRPGTRTTHPWLTNCTQCHASSATLDQMNFFGVNR